MAARVTVILGVWALLLLVTHNGPRSPYTYQMVQFEAKPPDLIAHPDAMTVLPVTRFFYDGTPPYWPLAHNLHLPFHSFATAMVVAFVRDYLLANAVMNLAFLLLAVFAAARLGLRSGLRESSLILGLMTVAALPGTVGYIGQPMHYIAGPAISWLVMLAAMALPEEDLSSPWISGALIAILTLNYDWYVYAAAFVALLATRVSFRRRFDSLLFLAVAATPALVWNLFVKWMARGTSSTSVRELFLESVLVEWAEFFRSPGTHPLLPYIATHIGMHIGLHHVIALIYWPLVVCAAIALWRNAPSASRATFICLALVAFFILEQLVSAAFDWENNSRRALAVVFAFACAWCRVVDGRSRAAAWRYGIYALLLLTAFLAMSDTLLHKAGASYLYTPYAIRRPPKDALIVEAKTLPRTPPPAVEQTQLLEPFPRARLHCAPFFAIAQFAVASALTLLFALLARARLLPRHAPAILAALWLLSAVRFL